MDEHHYKNKHNHNHLKPHLQCQKHDMELINELKLPNTIFLLYITSYHSYMLVLHPMYYLYMLVLTLNFVYNLHLLMHIPNHLGILSLYNHLMLLNVCCIPLLLFLFHITHLQKKYHMADFLYSNLFHLNTMWIFQSYFF